MVRTQERTTSSSPQGLSLISANGLRRQHLETKSLSLVPVSERDCIKGSSTGVVDYWSSKCGCGLRCVNRDGKAGDYDLRWVLLPNSFLKSGGLLFLERQFELDR